MHTCSKSTNCFNKVTLQSCSVSAILLNLASQHFISLFHISQQILLLITAKDSASHFGAHLLNASETFAIQRFLQLWKQVKF